MPLLLPGWFANPTVFKDIAGRCSKHRRDSQC